LRKYADKYNNISIGCSQANHGTQVFNALSADKPYNLRTSYCGASAGMYIFLPGGEVFSCWESIGKEYGKIGTYSADGMVIDPAVSAEWFGRNAAKIPEGLDCKYCLVCARGCAQYALYNKTLYKPLCDDF